MSATIGPLLRRAISSLDAARGPIGRDRRVALETQIGVDPDSGRLPVVFKLRTPRPMAGETWADYKARIECTVMDCSDQLSNGGRGAPSPIFSAGSVSALIGLEQIAALIERHDTELLELDPSVVVADMDDAIVDVDTERFRSNHGPLRGEGVRVAVLDSGIDKLHPHLVLADSVSACSETDDIPGSHGTHCAGSIASRDQVFPGVAPAVSLLNVKVLNNRGSGRHTDIARGVDAALDRNADVLSVSLGFNHLPTWWQGGHGWTCADGACVLCTAADNATALGASVVVAAGNEHAKAEELRKRGFGDSFDTEMGCPGHARHAITVAALTKRTFLPAAFSSRGPTAYGQTKPDIAAPGVNVTSTVPVPRQANGQVVASPARTDLFGRKSGTSMAAPIVAGAVALIVEFRKKNGLPTTPAEVRSDLLGGAVASLSSPENVIGKGRIDMGRYRALLA